MHLGQVVASDWIWETHGGIGCPRNHGWDSDVDFWTEGEGTPLYGAYEHNHECWAIEVTGQDWSSEEVALFLEDFVNLRGQL